MIIGEQYYCQTQQESYSCDFQKQNIVALVCSTSQFNRRNFDRADRSQMGLTEPCRTSCANWRHSAAPAARSPRR